MIYFEVTSQSDCQGCGKLAQVVVHEGCLEQTLCDPCASKTYRGLVIVEASPNAETSHDRT